MLYDFSVVFSLKVDHAKITLGSQVVRLDLKGFYEMSFCNIKLIGAKLLPIDNMMDDVTW